MNTSSLPKRTSLFPKNMTPLISIRQVRSYDYGKCLERFYSLIAEANMIDRDVKNIVINYACTGLYYHLEINATLETEY